MPFLQIRNKLPSGEKFTISLDGVPQNKTAFHVPETFRMKIEQYRISTSKKDVAEILGTVLTVLLMGGRAHWGSEMSSPYYAVWEGTCQMQEDGEIELWLHEDGVEVSFAPWSETVTFHEVESRTGGRDPAQVGRWALLNLPPLLFVSGVCLFLLFAVGIFADFFGLYRSQDDFIWVPKIIFTILPSYMLVYLWSSALRPFLGKKKMDWEKRMSRRLVIQIIVVSLLAGGAVFEILSFWVFDFGPAMITILPAAVLLIIHLTATGSILEQVERSGIRSGALEKKLQWSRRLRIAACGMVAVILLALLLKMSSL